MTYSMAINIACERWNKDCCPYCGKPFVYQYVFAANWPRCSNAKCWGFEAFCDFSVAIKLAAKRLQWDYSAEKIKPVLNHDGPTSRLWWLR